MPDIGVPTTGRLAGSAGDWAYGLGGGIAYTVLARVSDRFVGSPLVGAAVAGIGAGAIIEGNRGEIIATVAGFNSASTPEVAGFVNSAMDSIGI